GRAGWWGPSGRGGAPGGQHDREAAGQASRATLSTPSTRSATVRAGFVARGPAGVASSRRPPRPPRQCLLGRSGRLLALGGALLARALLEVFVEPAEDVPQALGAVGGLAAAREVVVLVREAHELRLAPQLLQRDVHLLALLDRAAIVLLRVEDQQRRGDVLDIADRRVLEQLLHVVPRLGLELHVEEHEADVAGAEEAQQV